MVNKTQLQGWSLLRPGHVERPCWGPGLQGRQCLERTYAYHTTVHIQVGLLLLLGTLKSSVWQNSGRADKMFCSSFLPALPRASVPHHQPRSCSEHQLYTRWRLGDCLNDDLSILVHTLASVHTHQFTASQVPLQVEQWNWPWPRSGGRLYQGQGFKKKKKEDAGNRGQRKVLKRSVQSQ